jgi:hypothetical protein
MQNFNLLRKSLSLLNFSHIPKFRILGCDTPPSAPGNGRHEGAPLPPLLHLPPAASPPLSGPYKRVRLPSNLTAPTPALLFSSPELKFTSHRAPQPSPLHHHHPTATPTPKLRWASKWSPRAPLAFPIPLASPHAPEQLEAELWRARHRVLMAVCQRHRDSPQSTSPTSGPRCLA